jgi:2-hydroxy-3-keto-5-methylthiopentenyl-1-phosphate phosphatase
VRVFCDFDGTIAVQDVGKELFSHYGGKGADTIAQQYLAGSITARQCLIAEADLVSDISSSRLGEFVDQFDIDPHFASFSKYCLQRNIPLVVLSDGLDFYVERILKRNQLEECTFFANHLEFVNVGVTAKFEITFPYTDSECQFCGNCKRNHMLTLSGDDDIIVYVGDGISDRCPVRFADIVFAKKELIHYCQQENISYYEYVNFGDVQSRIEFLLTKPRIKKRREAEMARREVFMQG